MCIDDLKNPVKSDMLALSSALSLLGLSRSTAADVIQNARQNMAKSASGLCQLSEAEPGKVQVMSNGYTNLPRMN